MSHGKEEQILPTMSTMFWKLDQRVVRSCGVCVCACAYVNACVRASPLVLDVVLDEENSVDTAVVFRVVGDLCVFPPHDLASCCDQSEFTHVDFNNRTLRSSTIHIAQQKLTLCSQNTYLHTHTHTHTHIIQNTRTHTATTHIHEVDTHTH